MMPNNNGNVEIITQGWLTKSPPSKGIFRPRWRKRWFVLRTGAFPHQYVLEYYTGETMRSLKGWINLDECEQLIGPLSVQERHKYTFQIRTPGRTYFLAADNEGEMSNWVASLCQVCSLKPVEDESDSGGVVYTRTGDENNKPTPPRRSGVEERGDNSSSDESSPTLSNKIQQSGPYIPISECFTGKPLPKSVEAPYSNIFQFPPQMNWANNSKRGESSGPPTPGAFSLSPAADLNSMAPLAPPRPPKPKKSENDGSPSPAPTPGNNNTTNENDDSSSTCSSLHSPPSSAGVVYCNIIAGEGIGNGDHSGPPPPPPPPMVDRNLKPRTSPSYLSSGAMTLPSRGTGGGNGSGGGSYKQQGLAFFAGPRGPSIDRSRKPSEPSERHPLSLGPTPAQIRQTAGTTSTLPSSSSPHHRRVGPKVPSPNDKSTFPSTRPIIYHEYEQANEMKGTYLQIECPPKDDSSPSASAAPHHKFHHASNASIASSTKSLTLTRKGVLDRDSSVEYRLIDHVKTKALNKTMEDREKRLRGNTLGKNSSHRH